MPTCARAQFEIVINSHRWYLKFNIRGPCWRKAFILFNFVSGLTFDATSEWIRSMLFSFACRADAFLRGHKLLTPIIMWNYWSIDVRKLNLFRHYWSNLSKSIDLSSFHCIFFVLFGNIINIWQSVTQTTNYMFNIGSMIVNKARFIKFNLIFFHTDKTYFLNFFYAWILTMLNLRFVLKEILS